MVLKKRLWALALAWVVSTWCTKHSDYDIDTVNRINDFKERVINTLILEQEWKNTQHFHEDIICDYNWNSNYLKWSYISLNNYHWIIVSETFSPNKMMGVYEWEDDSINVEYIDTNMDGIPERIISNLDNDYTTELKIYNDETSMDDKERMLYNYHSAGNEIINDCTVYRYME